MATNLTRTQGTGKLNQRTDDSPKDSAMIISHGKLHLLEARRKILKHASTVRLLAPEKSVFPVILLLLFLIPWPLVYLRAGFAVTSGNFPMTSSVTTDRLRRVPYNEVHMEVKECLG